MQDVVFTSLLSLVIAPQFGGWPVCLKALNYTLDPSTVLVTTQEQLLEMLLYVHGIMLVMLFGMTCISPVCLPIDFYQQGGWLSTQTLCVTYFHGCFTLHVAYQPCTEVHTT